MRCKKCRLSQYSSLKRKSRMSRPRLRDSLLSSAKANNLEGRKTRKRTKQRAARLRNRHKSESKRRSKQRRYSGQTSTRINRKSCTKRFWKASAKISLPSKNNLISLRSSRNWTLNSKRKSKRKWRSRCVKMLTSGTTYLMGDLVFARMQRDWRHWLTRSSRSWKTQWRRQLRSMAKLWTKRINSCWLGTHLKPVYRATSKSERL